MAALASASSKEEFEKTLEKATSLHGSAKNNSEEGSSQSNPYLQNEDMYYDWKDIKIEETWPKGHKDWRDMTKKT